MSKDIFTTHQIAKICYVDITTIGKWIDSGILPAYRTPGGHRRVRRQDLLDFLVKYKMTIPPELVVKSKHKTVLIVDDEEEIVTFITRAINKFLPEINIEVAYDGFEAGRKVIEHIPDLMILDIVLPGVDGYKVCESVRQNERIKHLKILAITGKELTLAEKKIIQSGADEFLAKPFSIEQLTSAIKRLLNIS